MFLQKPTLPLIIVFVIGVLAFAQEFVPHPLAGDFFEEMTSWMMIMGGFAMFLGLYSLLHAHATRIRRRVQGWGYSVFVYIGAAAMIIAGLWNDGWGPMVDVEQGKTWLDWGYTYVFTPCSATVFSILAFFMASAAFRTFRARNFAAALLLVSAVIVMFGRVPVSEDLGRLLGNQRIFPAAADALMDFPNLAAKRAIMMGISLGAIAQSLRILLGVERSYMGGGD